MRLLRGLRAAYSADDSVVLPSEGRSVLLPHPPDDVEGFVELSDPHRGPWEGETVPKVLFLVPPGSDAELKPPPAQDIQG